MLERMQLISILDHKNDRSEHIMDKKKIAHKILQFVGGKPKVVNYKDEEEKSDIDIYIGKDTPFEGINTYSTIGLSEYSIDLVVEDKELRVEFIGSCESEYKEYANILSSCAFNIINTQFSCSPGTVYSDVVREYYKETTMKHILFTDPFLWENIETLELSNYYVTWLMMVPISNEEFEFLKENGSEELENLFEKNNINLFDLNRKSVV
jgi:hypothetical protein